MQDLRRDEISQYHNIIRDFSNQSATIKKLAITIYVTFLSLYFGFSGTSPVVPKFVFWLIGLIIPVFCYIYEIHIDYTRQKLRAQMNNLCREYEKHARSTPRKIKYVRIKLLFLDFGLDSKRNLIIKVRNNDYVKRSSKLFYYVNLLHAMYIIYFFEAIITMTIGIWG